MKNIKPIFIFAAFLSGMISTPGMSGDKNHQKELELLPAIYSSGGQGSNQFEFLNEKPLNISLSQYKLDPHKLSVSISISEERSKSLLKLTKKYKDKRLAVVSNSSVVSSPEISVDVHAEQLDIGLNNEEDYERFVSLLGSQ